MNVETFCHYWFINTPLEFFTSVSADGLSLEFEWQQVFPSHQDSCQYSSRSQKCSCLDGLHLSSFFPIHQSLCHTFSDCTKSTNWNWYNRHSHVPQFFFSIPYQNRGTYRSFFSLSILLYGPAGQQSSQFCKFSFFSDLLWLLLNP